MPMTLPVGSSGNDDFKRAPPGSHIAVCNLVADCGIQPGSAKYPSPKRKIYVRFEIPDERAEYEKAGKKMEGPLTIGSFYTASMHEKATLREHLEGWRGRKFTDEEAAQFDVAKLLGQAAMLSVVESEKGGKTYSNIAGIGSIPRSVPVPKAENPLLYFDADSPPSDLDKLPEWLRKKIESQLSPKPNGETHAEFEDDDLSKVPF